MPRGGEIGSRGRPAFSFPTVIPRVVGLVRGPPNSEWGLLFLHIPSPAVFVSCLLTFAILTLVRLNLKTVLIWISLIARDDEHFFFFLRYFSDIFFPS